MLVWSVSGPKVINKLLTDFDIAGSDPVNYTSTSSDLAQGSGGSRGGSRGGSSRDGSRAAAAAGTGGLQSVKVNHGPKI